MPGFEGRAESASSASLITPRSRWARLFTWSCPKPGTEVIAGEPLGALESSKVTSDLMAPVSGEVVESNQALEEEPTLINDSPYERGWITRVRLKDPSEIDGLMEEAAYLAQVSAK